MVNEDNFIFYIKKKKEEGLYYLIDNYGNLIKTIVSKHLYGLPHYQEECINDILLEVWDSIQNYSEERQTFKYWLSTLCKYKCIDYKRKYLKKIVTENIDDYEMTDTTNIETDVIKQEISEEIDDLLKPLNENDKNLFIELYIKDIPIGIIAKKTGVTLGYIYNRLSRGKKKIKKGYVINNE